MLGFSLSYLGAGVFLLFCLIGKNGELFGLHAEHSVLHGCGAFELCADFFQVWRGRFLGEETSRQHFIIRSQRGIYFYLYGREFFSEFQAYFICFGFAFDNGNLYFVA